MRPMLPLCPLYAPSMRPMQSLPNASHTRFLTNTRFYNNPTCLVNIAFSLLACRVVTEPGGWFFNVPAFQRIRGDSLRAYGRAIEIEAEQDQQKETESCAAHRQNDFSNPFPVHGQAMISRQRAAANINRCRLQTDTLRVVPRGTYGKWRRSDSNRRPSRCKR